MRQHLTQNECVVCGVVGPDDGVIDVLKVVSEELKSGILVEGDVAIIQLITAELSIPNS